MHLEPQKKKMTETWAWIGGWGIQPTRMAKALEQALPGTCHTVFHPSPQAFDQLLDTKAHRFGGYSLGSLLLLQNIHRLPLGPPPVCLAPILGFCSEDQLGGTTPRSTIQNLRRRLAKDPVAAIRLFHRLAKFRDEPAEPIPYNPGHLDWGLEALASRTVQNKPPLSRVCALIGSNDPLTKPHTVANYFERTRIVPGLHSYNELANHLDAAFA